MSKSYTWSTALSATIMQKYPNPDDFPYKSWSYSQAFMLWGIERLYVTTGEKKYYDYILKYADAHVDNNGNSRGFSGDSLDDIMAGSIFVWAYHQTHLEKYKLAADKVRQVFNSYPRTLDGVFWHASALPGEVWVDGAFMGLLFLSKYGNFVGDSDFCFNEAAMQLELIEKHCKKGNSGLLYHAWSEDKRSQWADPVTGCSPEVWSEGLGWYGLALIEVIEALPLNHSKRDMVIKLLENLLEGLKNTQDAKTGLWYQVVDKGHLEDNWHDTSGSAMFVYTVKRAVEMGLASTELYDKAVDAGYRGITSKCTINSSGLIDIYDACDGLCVQDSYKKYIDYPKTVNAKEATAAVLWATWVVERPGQSAV